MAQLDGRRALVTGALGTLGRAMTARLAEEGAHVGALDRPDAADGAARAAGLGPGVTWLGVDLNDLAGAERAVREAAGATDGFDILINNAALIINKPFEEFSLGEYEDQIRVNSSAAFALARAVAPGMKAKGAGRIVNLTSVTLTGEWDGYVPYVASKGAMYGLTKGLARELGPHGINVNAIAPGAVVSEAEERVFGDRLQAYQAWVLENQCLKKRIEARHVADLALFLVSDAAEMITGQNFHIDGGW